MESGLQPQAAEKSFRTKLKLLKSSRPKMELR
jgi:hypothetical protein